MIDAINLIFREYLLEVLVQLFRGFQIMAKRFLDNDPSPVSTFFFRKPRFPESLDNGREKSRRDSKIEKLITDSIVLFIGILNLLLKPLVRLRIIKISLYVVDALGKPIP